MAFAPIFAAYFATAVAWKTRSAETESGYVLFFKTLHQQQNVKK
jgi:hypothetical protein